MKSPTSSELLDREFSMISTSGFSATAAELDGCVMVRKRNTGMVISKETDSKLGEIDASQVSL